MKKGLFFLALPAFFAFVAPSPASLDWSLLYETTWEQRSDETNNQNLWIPEFSKKLTSLNGKEVKLTGYLSVDAVGRTILTQFKRNPKSEKDRSAEAPDYVFLNGLDESTYYAELKKYTVKGVLQLNSSDVESPAFNLLKPELVK
jgi:hypothetical protein